MTREEHTPSGVGRDCETEGIQNNKTCGYNLQDTVLHIPVPSHRRMLCQLGLACTVWSLVSDNALSCLSAFSRAYLVQLGGGLRFERLSSFVRTEAITVPAETETEIFPV
jgi:hypothetical protein